MRSRSKMTNPLLRRVFLFLSFGLVASFSFAAPVTAFTTNFDGGADLEFSGVISTEGVQSYSGIGTGANIFGGLFLRNITPLGAGSGISGSPTVLTLTGLPPHTSIDLNFLLAIIDSWDGNGCLSGPDNFNVTVDGVLIFSEVFENSNCGAQTYVPPSGVELARRADLGFHPAGSFYADSAYDMGLDPAFNGIPHTASTLTIEWFANGGGWQGGDPNDGITANDESWAIDNVEVILFNTTSTSIDVTISGTLTRATDSTAIGNAMVFVTDDISSLTNPSPANVLAMQSFPELGPLSSINYSINVTVDPDKSYYVFSGLDRDGNGQVDLWRVDSSGPTPALAFEPYDGVFVPEITGPVLLNIDMILFNQVKAFCASAILINDALKDIDCHLTAIPGMLPSFAGSYFSACGIYSEAVNIAEFFAEGKFARAYIRSVMLAQATLIKVPAELAQIIDPGLISAATTALTTHISCAEEQFAVCGGFDGSFFCCLAQLIVNEAPLLQVAINPGVFLSHFLTRNTQVITCSPVEIFIFDTSGNMLNSSTREIPGSLFLQHEGDEWALVPDEAGPLDISIVGTGFGPATINIFHTNSVSQTNRILYTDVPFEPGMIASLHLDADERNYVLLLDSDGDGTIDGEILPSSIEMILDNQPLDALIDVDPDALNLKSNGQWVTAYITLPTGFDVNNIDPTTIEIVGLLGNTCDPAYIQPADLSFTPQVGDHDEDAIPDLTVKFDRQLLILNLCTDDVAITIEGNLTSGERFSGTDQIRVINH